ncbi:pyridoxal phosphate (PLP)-dependent transferases superfamily protein isoform X2 [Wolffia australiana]
MSYNADGGPSMTRELERHVRLLHKFVGNANVEGKFMVFGAGSTQLLNAALHALAPDISSSPATVVASVPYYPAYKTQTAYWNDFEWKGATSDLLNSTRSSRETVIEFVTSPNNPDGRWQLAVVYSAATTYDRAYYWPHFSAIKTPADDDLSLFTLSKISGHAGSRFGWALIKNKTIYERIVMYMDEDTMGVSRDTQLRALKIIKEMIMQIKKKGDIFRFGYALTRDRWAKLNAVVASSDRFSLQKLSPEYCNYFRITRDPSPAYAWLKCERETDMDCATVMRTGGIIPREGILYGASSQHVRLSLIKSHDDFDQLLTKMKSLASH